MNKKKSIDFKKKWKEHQIISSCQAIERINQNTTDTTSARPHHTYADHDKINTSKLTAQ